MNADVDSHCIVWPLVCDCHCLQVYSKLVADNKKARKTFEHELIAMETKYEQLKSDLISSHQLTLDGISQDRQKEMMETLQNAEKQLGELRQVHICVLNLLLVSHILPSFK